MEKFLAAVRNMFQLPDLPGRILFYRGILALYRLGAHSLPRNQQIALDQFGNMSADLLGVLICFPGGNFR